MNRLKVLLKSRLPGVIGLIRRVRGRSLRRKDPAEIFREIHESNTWGDAESVSGSGSNLRETAALRNSLPGLIDRFDVKSMLDAPCGDFYWMQHVDLSGVRYIGGDIVEKLVVANRERHGAPDRDFRVLNVLADELPEVDLILCRDCLVHFSAEHVWAAVESFKRSGSTYLATTTFVERTHNDDIITGQWRPLNLQLEPFNFGTPLLLLNEDSVIFDGNFADKSLAIWRIADLPSPVTSAGIGVARST